MFRFRETAPTLGERVREMRRMGIRSMFWLENGVHWELIVEPDDVQVRRADLEAPCTLPN